MPEEIRESVVIIKGFKGEVKGIPIEGTKAVFTGSVEGGKSDPEAREMDKPGPTPQ